MNREVRQGLKWGVALVAAALTVMVSTASANNLCVRKGGGDDPFWENGSYLPQQFRERFGRYDSIFTWLDHPGILSRQAGRDFRFVVKFELPDPRGVQLPGHLLIQFNAEGAIPVRVVMRTGEYVDFDLETVRDTALDREALSDALQARISQYQSLGGTVPYAVMMFPSSRTEGSYLTRVELGRGQDEVFLHSLSQLIYPIR